MLCWRSEVKICESFWSGGFDALERVPILGRVFLRKTRATCRFRRQKSCQTLFSQGNSRRNAIHLLQ